VRCSCVSDDLDMVDFDGGRWIARRWLGDCEDEERTDTVAAGCRGRFFLDKGVKKPRMVDWTAGALALTPERSFFCCTLLDPPSHSSSSSESWSECPGHAGITPSSCASGKRGDESLERSPVHSGGEEGGRIPMNDELGGDDDRQARDDADMSSKMSEDDDDDRGTFEPYVCLTTGLNRSIVRPGVA